MTDVPRAICDETFDLNPQAEPDIRRRCAGVVCSNFKTGGSKAYFANGAAYPPVLKFEHTTLLENAETPSFFARSWIQ